LWDLVAVGHEAVVAGAVGVAVEKARVVPATVGLDEESALGVAQLDAADPAVTVADVDLAFRWRQSAIGEDPEQATLQLARRGDVPPAARFEERPERDRAVAPVVGEVVEHPPARRHTDEPPGERGVERTLGATEGDRSGQVEQRARRRRRGDAVEGPAVVVGEPQRLDDLGTTDDPPPPTTRRDEVDRLLGEAG
jgi:hypothetical protein